MQAAIERNLAGIDRGDNMAVRPPPRTELACAAPSHSRRPRAQVDFRDDRWFVYDMTRKLDANNGLLGRVLADVKTKLDLLAKQVRRCVPPVRECYTSQCNLPS